MSYKYYKFKKEDVENINNFVEMENIQTRDYCSPLQIVCEEEAELRLNLERFDENISDKDLIKIDKLTDAFYYTQKELLDYNTFDIIEMRLRQEEDSIFNK